MPSNRDLFTFTLLTLIFPLLINAQGYNFGNPPPPLPTKSGPAQYQTPAHQNTPQGSYNTSPPPTEWSYGSKPSPPPTNPGIYVSPPDPYVSKQPSGYIPHASAPANPVYGPPPSNPTPPSYILPPSYGNGINSSDPTISSSTSSIFSACRKPYNSTVRNGGATSTGSAGGAFSSLRSISTTGGGCACLTQPANITIVIQTSSVTITSVLTQFKTETVTVQTINLVNVPVISNVISTSPTFDPAPTTLQILTVGVDLNLSSTIQTNGGSSSTTTPSSPTGVVVPSVYGRPLSYAYPAPSGYGLPKSYGSSLSATYGSPSGYGGGTSGYSSQPPKYNQPSTYNSEGDNYKGHDSSTRRGGEEGSCDAGPSSYGDSEAYKGDTCDDGDVETGSWTRGSDPDSEDGGRKTEEQSGGSVFLDWLHEILK